MKFNIKPSDCQFIVNKEKKNIVCILQPTRCLFINFIRQNSKIPLERIITNKDLSNFINQLLMPNRFIGIANCSPDDEFNEDIGKSIAFSRMKDKVNKSFFKRAKIYFNTLDNWLDEAVEVVNQLGEKLEKNQKHRHEYIEKLLK